MIVRGVRTCLDDGLETIEAGVRAERNQAKAVSDEFVVEAGRVAVDCYEVDG